MDNQWENLGEDADGDGHVIEFNGIEWVFDPDDENNVDDDGNGKIDDFVGWNFINENGEQAGELIGPKVQANPYKLDFHEWYPFEKAVAHLKYKSFHEHERNFERSRDEVKNHKKRWDNYNCST